MISNRNLFPWFMLGLFTTLALGQPANRGPHCCMGMGGDQDHFTDMETIHYLLDNRSMIRRSVENLPTGVETLTESDDPQVAAGIKKHVGSMYERMKQARPIHQRDPLFRELFNQADKIHMDLEETDNGVRVRETSEDPQVAKLVQEHARVLNLFLANGRAEVHKNHALP